MLPLILICEKVFIRLARVIGGRVEVLLECFVDTISQLIQRQPLAYFTAVAAKNLRSLLEYSTGKVFFANAAVEDVFFFIGYHCRLPPTKLC